MKVSLGAERNSRRLQFKRRCVDPALPMSEPVELADHAQFVIDGAPPEGPASVRAHFRCEDVPVGCNVKFAGMPPGQADPLTEAEPIRQLVCVTPPCRR